MYLLIHDIETLHVALHGCEPWPLTLTEKHRLKVSENGVVRELLGSKKEGVRGSCEKAVYEELRDFHVSPKIMRVIKLGRMRWAGHVVRMRVERNVYKVLVGKPEGKRPLEILDVTGWIILKCVLRKY